MGDFSETFKTAYPERYELLKKYAKENRLKMTPSEQAVWEQLRNKQLGFCFRRQHPIGDYIADFFCYKLKLIIEIDGKYHEKSNQQEDDNARTTNLEALGYTILRFTNTEILCSMDRVLNKIREKTTILDK